MTPENIWKTLSTIDVNKHVQDKGGFNYLSWTWAWATVKQVYPMANFRFLDDRTHASGTIEVWCEVTIEGLTHQMWLAVTDFKNKAVPNPSCDLIANTRMRCLVKCLAMFGLGHYIYAGESLPMERQLDDKIRDQLLAHMGTKNAIKFYELYKSITDEEKGQFFNGFKDGHKSAQKQLVRDLLSEFRTLADNYVSAVVEACEASDEAAVKQLDEEMKENPIVHITVQERLSDAELTLFIKLSEA